MKSVKEFDALKTYSKHQAYEQEIKYSPKKTRSGVAKASRSRSYLSHGSVLLSVKFPNP